MHKLLAVAALLATAPAAFGGAPAVAGGVSAPSGLVAAGGRDLMVVLVGGMGGGTGGGGGMSSGAGSGGNAGGMGGMGGGGTGGMSGGGTGRGDARPAADRRDERRRRHVCRFRGRLCPAGSRPLGKRRLVLHLPVRHAGRPLLVCGPGRAARQCAAQRRRLRLPRRPQPRPSRMTRSRPALAVRGPLGRGVLAPSLLAPGLTRT